MCQSPMLQRGPSQLAFIICLLFLNLVGGIIAAPSSVKRLKSGQAACDVIKRDEGQKQKGLQANDWVVKYTHKLVQGMGGGEVRRNTEFIMRLLEKGQKRSST